ncbi:MAG: hypothetical protein HYY09_05680 [Firmicutes bacterium]|nr:hypothetical protein [Bacillota bacterium]
MQWRKKLPILITLAAGIFVVVSRFVKIEPLPTLSGTLDEWFLVSAAFAFVIGMANLTRLHLLKVRSRGKDWPYSLVLLVCLYGYLTLGLTVSVQGPAYEWVYRNILGALQGAMFSLLAFFTASAAYRAFRIRSAEATVLMITAAVVMVGNIPLGESIAGGNIPGLAQWILDVPNTAGARGILLGAAVGALATSVRILLGLERAHLGGPGA